MSFFTLTIQKKRALGNDKSFKLPVRDDYPYWSIPTGELYSLLNSRAEGLNDNEAVERLRQYGKNVLKVQPVHSLEMLLFRQLKNPLIIILIVAAFIAGLMYDWVEAFIILGIVFFSVLVSLKKEHNAVRAVEELKKMISMKAMVVRDGLRQEIDAVEVVPGDVIILSAGSMVPADGRIIEAEDLYINESALTGESFPSNKISECIKNGSSVQELKNMVFTGTSVRSGTGKVLITATGSRSRFGHIARRLAVLSPENDFEKGLKHFSYLLTRIILVLIIIVFCVNILGSKPTIESLLFAIALAVGMTPELLPAILTFTLSTGAQKMSEQGVIVKKLSAIETIGSMNILCTDKTGTLTAGVISLDSSVGWDGQVAQRVERMACMNACFQQGLQNPLDEALIRRSHERKYDFSSFSKIAEIPYDFIRKRLTIAIKSMDNNKIEVISKGAFTHILSICSSVEKGDTVTPLTEQDKGDFDRMFQSWGEQGYRVLGVAYKQLIPNRLTQIKLTKADEVSFIFAGFLLFYDPPKEEIKEVLNELKAKGVQIKILTGDNRYVTQHIAGMVGLNIESMITGDELQHIKEDALILNALETDLFAELDPNQKERIIRALKKSGYVVGFLGDGINDATALYEADVGVSVDSAVDVAKDSADFVLLKHDLSVLLRGIEEGRITFANTLKYILTTSSANFGNMISMAAASAFLPFLPLLAKQILLNNFLSDIPGMSLAGDRVDEESVRDPQTFRMSYIRNFMIVFGLISTLFDFLTFGFLLWVLHASEEEFRTAWFIESLLTEVIIIFVIRTHRRVYQSTASPWLSLNALATVAVAFMLPYLPLEPFTGFVPLSLAALGGIIGISLLYTSATEWAKMKFYALLR